MAGHSKWANIKHRKERADAKKGKVFSRMAKEVISAVKMGGPDPKSNPRLRLAILNAKNANVPNEIIDRNIKKASSQDQADFTEMTYELYGHGGVGILAEVMTDNKNRISSDMRIATNKRGGSVAMPGSVAFNFDRRGIIQVQKKNAKEDELFLASSEAGAEDFEDADEMFMVITSPENMLTVRDAITALGIPVDQAEFQMIPKSNITVDEETMKANLALIEWLEDLDDVDTVYHNMHLPDEEDED